MTLPSLVIGLTPEAPNDITHARRTLEALRSETLDELRDHLHEILTSQLLIMFMSGAIPLNEQEEALPAPQVQAIVTAGLLAISDELDRRIPIPKSKTPATKR